MNRNRYGNHLRYAILLLVAATIFSACGGGGGGSSPSPLPATPTSLTANAISVSRIDLTWADKSDNEGGFKIERSTNSLFTGPSTTIVGTVTANATSYSSTGLAPSTTYYYRVRAYNSAGDSGNSNVVNASTFTVSTLAGVVTTPSGTVTYVPPLSGSANGIGPDARFKYPYGIASSSTDIYVADTMNHVIRKIDKTTKTVTTLAGSPTVTGSADGTGATARFNYPYGIAVDGTDLYVADTMNHVIRKVNTGTGEVTTIAGTMGVSGSKDDNTTGTLAQFNQPIGITADSSFLYVADSLNHTIRKYNKATTAVATLAGSALVSGATDSVGTAARFNQPFGVAVVVTDLFVTDYNNHTVRKVDTNSGMVTTMTGTALISGTADGAGTAARFKYPAGIATDGASLYVADSQNHTIRQIVVTSTTVTTLVGTAGISGASSTTFNYPHGVTYDGSDLYVADTYNHDIRKVLTGTPYTVSLVAGYDVSSVSSALFDKPIGITSVGTGTIYVTDNKNCVIWEMDKTTGVPTVLVGTSGACNPVDGTGPAAGFYFPEGMTSDGTDLYVADTQSNTIRRIIVSTATVTTVAGFASLTGNSNDGVGTAARFNHPVGLATDGTYLYVTDHNNSTIRKIEIASQNVTTLAGLAANQGGGTGSTDGVGTAARFDHPTGITIIDTYLYILDYANQTIRKVHKTTGAVTTLAGVAPNLSIPGSGIGSADSTDGTGRTARFNYPRGITTDGVYLYVADTGNYTIRRVDPNTGDSVTLAGAAGAVGSTDSTTSAARFSYPNGIFWENDILYVADTNNNTIRVIY